MDFDTPGANHAALGRVWARTKIAHLKDGLTQGADPDEMRQAITDLALRHNLVSDFTAFVAVDSTRVTEGEHGTTVPVAVPVPEGTRYETAVGGN